jgi:hypothetical protein
MGFRGGFLVFSGSVFSFQEGDGGGCAAGVGGDGAPPSRGFEGRCRAGCACGGGRRTATVCRGYNGKKRRLAGFY